MDQILYHYCGLEAFLSIIKNSTLWLSDIRKSNDYLECVYCRDKMEQIREELADVLNYSILMADACGLDLDEIIRDKVKKNNEKYPVEKAYGSKEKYTELKRR